VLALGLALYTILHPQARKGDDAAAGEGDTEAAVDAAAVDEVDAVEPDSSG
jgi:hypothetical protein